MSVTLRFGIWADWSLFDPYLLNGTNFFHNTYFLWNTKLQLNLEFTINLVLTLKWVLTTEQNVKWNAYKQKKEGTVFSCCEKINKSPIKKNMQKTYQFCEPIPGWLLSMETYPYVTIWTLNSGPTREGNRPLVPWGRMSWLGWDSKAVIRRIAGNLRAIMAWGNSSLIDSFPRGEDKGENIRLMGLGSI